MNANELILHVLPAADSDAKEQADLAGGLRAELLDTDVGSVTLVTTESTPDSAKGAGALAGWLAAQFGTADSLRMLVGAVRRWASRTGRTVEVSIGEDTLKLTAATSEQQAEIVAAWLARHAPGA